jgi:large subunit ribosomal protein L19
LVLKKKKKTVQDLMSINYQELIRRMESKSMKSDLPDIEVGDTVKVGVLIQEGNKERVQPYEGTVIAKRRAGLHTTITVRRVFQGIGVERVFTPHSPAIKNFEIIRRSKVRRAKLYYLRERSGKGTRLTPRLES